MGLFGNQFANVVEWEEYRDDILFWKWSNQEIKKGSRLIIRPGQEFSRMKEALILNLRSFHSCPR